MPTLTVRVSTVVVKEYEYEGISFDEEDDYCEDAKEQMQSDLEDTDWKVSHSSALVQWEGEEG